MSKLIRKITIGKDYKIDAMHYSVGQEVYGGHTICDIVEEKEKYSIYIKKNIPFFIEKIFIYLNHPRHHHLYRKTRHKFIRDGLAYKNNSLNIYRMVANKT